MCPNPSSPRDIGLRPWLSSFRIRARWCGSVEQARRHPPDEMSWAKGKVEVGDLIWASVLARAGQERTRHRTDASSGRKRARKGKAAPEPDQDPAQTAGQAHVEVAMQLEPRIEGAIVSMTRARRGAGLRGRFSFEKSQFNRATQGFRQPGSSFKPIVYSVAMDNGMTPATGGAGRAVFLCGPLEQAGLVPGQL